MPDQHCVPHVPVSDSPPEVLVEVRCTLWLCIGNVLKHDGQHVLPCTRNTQVYHGC